MAIKFLKDYETRAHPPEQFTAGQLVKTLSEASERHFVSRGVAGFVGKGGALTDYEGREIASDGAASVITVNVSANRDGGPGRAGETGLIDGTPQRASSGPGVVMTTSGSAGESIPDKQD